MLQLWQGCPRSLAVPIVGCLRQLLLHFSVEKPSPFWAYMSLEESLQFRSLYRPQKDHGLCITQSKEAIKPLEVFFNVPCTHCPFLPPNSSKCLDSYYLELYKSHWPALLVAANTLWGCGKLTIPELCHSSAPHHRQDPSLLPQFSPQTSHTPPLPAISASLPTLQLTCLTSWNSLLSYIIHSRRFLGWFFR